MTGHASPADLAAMGLGASVYSSVVMGLTGVVIALNPIIAHHYGAERWEAIGASYVQGLWLAVLLSMVGMPLLAFPEPWLTRIGAAPDVEALVTPYLRLLSFSLPASLLFRATYAFNVAVSRPKVMMTVQVVGLALKVALNYALIFGGLGLPRLGVVGCGVATLIVHWALFGLAWAYMRLDPAYRRFAIGLARPRWPALREHLQLGVPIGLSYVLESTSFSFVTLLIARLGTSVTGGHQIISNLAALGFQIPLAISLATATLTAQAIGAGDLGRARRAAFTGIRTQVGVGLVTAATFWTLRRGIVGLCTEDAAVTAVALSLDRLPGRLSRLRRPAGHHRIRAARLPDHGRAHDHLRGRALGPGPGRRVRRGLRPGARRATRRFRHVADAISGTVSDVAAPPGLLPPGPRATRRALRAAVTQSLRPMRSSDSPVRAGRSR
jgi:MATE family multidrug resistance protein